MQNLSYSMIIHFNWGYQYKHIIRYVLSVLLRGDITVISIICRLRAQISKILGL